MFEHGDLKIRVSFRQENPDFIGKSRVSHQQLFTKRRYCMKFIKPICVILLLSLFHTAALAEETIRITSGEWPPYLSEKLKCYGVASRIVTEAFTLEGVKVEYGFFPWKRSFLLAQKGKWDGSVVWAHTEDRARDFYYSDPVVESKWVFFHLKTTSFDWKAIEDLRGFKIGGTLEYKYNPDFKAAEEAGKITVYRVPKDEQNFEKVIKGRIDIFPQDIDVGYEMLNSLFSKEEVSLFTHHPKPIKDTSFHLLLSKKSEKSKNMLTLFNKGLKRLRESGKTEQYLRESRVGEYKK